VTDRAQSQRLPGECNGLIQVFGIAAVIKAGVEMKRKIVQWQGPICVTNRAQSQRFPVKCDGLIQVSGITPATKAVGELIRKIIQ
jgi:hypothetical protein